MKNKLTGWKKICSFAYAQSMKSKAMIFTIIILSVIALISMPVITLITGNDNEEEHKSDEKTAIQKVYIYDNTDIIAEQFINKDVKSEVYADVTYEQRENCDDVEKIIKSKENKNEIFLVIEYCDDEKSIEYGINIVAYYNPESEVTDEDANAYVTFIDENIRRAILISADTQQENIDKLTKEIGYEVKTINEKGEIEENTNISMFQYYFALSFICIFIFVITLIGSKVSELIVTEKSTRVMEYILTSVKPMAVLVGKVIASTAVMFTMLLSVVACFVVSLFINNAMFPAEDGKFVLPSVISNLVDKGGLTGVTPINMVVIILLILLGGLFYGCIAGIAGATVSKIEEMAEGMKIFSFTMVIGAYLPLFLTMSTSISGDDWGILTNVVYLLPISSVFILPTYLLMGKITISTVLWAVLVLIIAIVLVMLLVNKVYEHMLYSNGETLKIKDIIKFAKSDKGEKNE